MKLDICAFTGADDAVNPADLAALSRIYPFAEWSILLLPGQGGAARTPTADWIRNFKGVCVNTHTCIHLCGPALSAFVGRDPEVLELMKGFKRVQFNFEYLDAGKDIDPAALARRAKETPEQQFILQYGKSYKHYLPHFNDVPNHALLFDGSAGEGISPDAWPAPIPGHLCGYAGGINPGNVARHLEAIKAAVPAGYGTWIDMESGVRTGDVFDLEKVGQVLESVKEYVRIKNQPP